ncbi:hypothetical protein C8Q80DRAFT_1109695 [Daedaleopsis nitida]|nr:hypothetical protein C8Q80DRAFT_1109695 [Daedaleopsis nitida]
MSSARSEPTRAQLLAAAQALCNAFANKADTDTLLSHFSSSHQISAFEHGLPALAPFLGRAFTGRAGPASVAAYFRLLQQHLTYDDMSFGTWVVDADAQRVSVKGHARFTWAEGAGKGQCWDEHFAYILDFDQDAKVTDYQVWADSGAAYLARRGELSQLTGAVTDPKVGRGAEHVKADDQSDKTVVE